jgi:plastocyanin
MQARAWTAAAAVALVAGTADVAAAQQTVTTVGNTFSPASVTVMVGGTVSWTNAGGMHNVHFDDGSYEDPLDAELPSDPQWDSVMRAFSTPGVFGYYCDLHVTTDNMRGTVTVLAPGTPPPGTPPPGTPPPPGTAPPGAPGQPRTAVTVSLRVSDKTPRAGQLVRFSGSVRPALDGRSVQIQRRKRGGGYRTIATARLRDAGDERSKFSRRIRIAGDGVFRARLGGDATHATGISRPTRLNVPGG